MIIIGVLFTQVGLVFQVANGFISEGGGWEYRKESQQRRTNNDIGSIIFITTGSALIIRGITMKTRKKYDTENKWRLKTGYYIKK